MSAPAAQARPAPADESALIRATFANFPPCDCERSHRVCAGHAFLFADPTGRGLLAQWQALLFARFRREALVRQEAARVEKPTVWNPGSTLPW